MSDQDLLKELFKRVDTSVLYQPFVEKCKQLLLNCEKRGVRYYAISGYRSVTEQNALFAQGRTKPGTIVTKARGGQSAHNFGVALDFCKDMDIKRAGLQPSWNVPDYEILAQEALSLGLEAGFFWGFVDAPHIQLPLAKMKLNLFNPGEGKSNSDWPNLYDQWVSGKIKGVYSFLDTNGG